MFHRSSRYSTSGRIRWPFWTVLLALTALLMHRWLGSSLPLSPRGESQVGLGFIWLLRRLWEEGEALSPWNPYLLAGMPTSTAKGYGLHLSLAAISSFSGLSPESLIKAAHAFATFMSGLGMYLYLRILRASPFSATGVPGETSPGAAIISATIYCYFPARVMLTLESISVALVWAGLPWALWAHERIQGSIPRCIRPAIVWALPLAGMALTDLGWFLTVLPIVAFYVLLRRVCLWIAATRGVSATFANRAPPRAGTQIKALGLSVIVALSLLLGLSLFSFLPKLLERNLLWVDPLAQTYPAIARWSVPPSFWASTLALRLSPSIDPMAWDLARIFPNITWYLGLAACALALVATMALREWPRTLPLVGVLIVSLLLAAGPAIPQNLAWGLVRRVPFLAGFVRDTFRYFWPASFALASLAGVGYDRLFRSSGSDAFASSMRQFLIALAVVMVILIDYWPVTQAYGTVQTYFERDEIQTYQLLDGLADHGRYWVPFQAERPGLNYTDTSYSVRYTARAHVSDNAYHSRSAPNRAAWLFSGKLKSQVDAGQALSPQAQAILDLSNVRYLLLHLWPEGYRSSLERLIAAPSWELLASSQHIAVLENRSVRPYAHAYAGGVLTKTFGEAEGASLPVLLQRGYALVEQVDGQDAESQSAGRLLRSWDGAAIANLPTLHVPDVQLELARPTSTEIWIRFEAREPFLLTISETWYPHWQVYVNGERRALLRLNGNFQGVYVDSHEGHVLYRYHQPWYVWLGRFVSLVSLIGLLLYLLRPQPVRLRPDV